VRRRQIDDLTAIDLPTANCTMCRADEPTSGLDARAAQIVMRVVRNIGNSMRTIVCTIHQPSAEIFLHFDELLLLKRGGQQIYTGPLGRESATLVDYFQSIPGVRPLRAGYNPASYMLEVRLRDALSRPNCKGHDVLRTRCCMSGEALEGGV
jgi:ABC-type multidrug transport system ATPase subunit